MCYQQQVREYGYQVREGSQGKDVREVREVREAESKVEDIEK